MRKRCLQRGCPVRITHGSYCDEHKPYGGDWAALSARVLAEEHHRCWNCGGRATTTDHIRPTSQFASLAEANQRHNLRAACRACNSSKGGL